jgi:uncharacterized RDD family membrane protein YckC
VTHDQPLDTTVAIEAPEQIRFRHRLAGPAQRAMAHLIDLLIIGMALFVIAVLVGLIVASAAPLAGADGLGKASIGVILVAVFGLQWGYFALFEGLWHGRTPGKAALSLRVVKNGGEPIGFVDGVLRNLLRAADWMPFGYAAAVVTMFVDPRFRRLGDLVAGTMVVVEDRLRVAVPLYIHPPTPDEARMLPPRVVLDGDELRAIELFLRRAAELGPALAAELASSVAPALARKYGYRHPDPIRLLALLYLRATAQTVFRAPSAAAPGASGGPAMSYPHAYRP